MKNIGDVKDESKTRTTGNTDHKGGKGNSRDTYRQGALREDGDKVKPLEPWTHPGAGHLHIGGTEGNKERNKYVTGAMGSIV